MIRSDKEEWRHNGKGDKQRSEMDGIEQNRTKYNKEGYGDAELAGDDRRRRSWDLVVMTQLFTFQSPQLFQSFTNHQPR